MARGADDRRFPWGYQLCASMGSHQPQFSDENSYVGIPLSIDESPYGIRALSGCIREFTSIYREKDGFFEVRGSSWFDPARHADVTSCNFYRGHAVWKYWLSLGPFHSPTSDCSDKDEPS